MQKRKKNAIRKRRTAFNAISIIDSLAFYGELKNLREFIIGLNKLASDATSSCVMLRNPFYGSCDKQ